MGTKKPRIQVILEVEEYQKVKYLCEKEDRSESKMTRKMIKHYLTEYENINGKIQVNPNESE